MDPILWNTPFQDFEWTPIFGTPRSNHFERTRFFGTPRSKHEGATKGHEGTTKRGGPERAHFAGQASGGAPRSAPLRSAPWRWPAPPVFCTSASYLYLLRCSLRLCSNAFPTSRIGGSGGYCGPQGSPLNELEPIPNPAKSLEHNAMNGLTK